MAENQQELGDIGIGTKDSQTLQAKPVQVQGFRIDPVKKKESGEEVGQKVVLICKHPDKDDSIELSKTKYVRGDNLNLAGLWFNKDDDGLIPKSSALAQTMSNYSVSKLNEFENTEIQTELDKNGYLVVKAY